MPINCYLPIRVRLVGTPGEAELAQLPVTVARAVASRLEAARRLITERHAGGAADGQVHERFDPGRDTESGYSVSSYDSGGAPVGVPIRSRARPWLVLRAMYFRTAVGDFFNWVDQERAKPLAARVLYADLDADVRSVTVWWVQTNLTVSIGELSETLVARARQLASLGSNQTLLYGITPWDAGRDALAELDPTGRVRSLPPLAARNARRVEGSGADTVLLHGSRVVFAFMALPTITTADLLILGTGAVVELRLRETAFLLDPVEFETAFGVSWDQFLDEFGNDPVQMELQSATMRREARLAAIGYLLATEVEPRRQPSAAPGGAAPRACLLVQRWGVLTDVALVRMPAPVRRLAQSWTDPATRALDDGAVGDRLQPGWRVLYASAVLPVNRERVVAAQLRPRARELAELLRQRLRGDPSESAWRWGLYDFLGGHFGTQPAPARPPGGTLFEHVLVELEAIGDLIQLYDAADATGHFGLRHRLLLISLPTSYATHPRVRRLHADLSTRALSNLAYGYYPDANPPEIWFDRDPERRVRVGEVLGDLNSIYLADTDIKRLKPARAQQLREACDRERIELSGRIARGEDSTDYSEEEFATQVLALAAKATGIAQGDFEQVTIQRSIKIVGVSRQNVQALPTFEVAFRIVERLKGSGSDWVPVSDVMHEVADDFQARLIYWQLGRTSEVYDAVLIGISVVGLVAVAWEVGLVAALVELGGGTTAVMVSITISEVIYIYQIVYGDAELSLGGFLLAALNGYLMALGFRAGAGLGQLVTGRIGTASLRRLLAGWVAQKLITGVVGGSLSAGLTTFAHDVIAILTGTGSWSSLGDYVKHMTIGAVVGGVAEFTLTPALQALLTRGGSALSSVAELVTRLRAEGWSGIRLSATLTEGLTNLRAALTELAGDATTSGLVTAFRERIGEVLEQMGAGWVSRRVLEVAGAHFTRQATEGLQRFLVAAEAAAPSRALAITNVFAQHSQETVHFLEVLAQLDAAAARRLVDGTFGSQADLAAFLGRLARYTPQQQRAAIRMLGELDIQVGPPVPGLTTEQVLQRQLDLSLRLQNAGIDMEVAQLRREIASLEQRLARTDPGNLRRADALRREIEERTRRLTGLQAQADEAAAAGATGPRDVVPSDDEIESALTALEEGTAGGGAGPQAWIRLPARSVRNSPTVVERLVRPIFRSRSGNRVVFRVEGGTDPAARSRELVHIDDDRNVLLTTGGRALNLNFGVFERALEFLIANRAGARLKVFEIEEAWFRAARGVSTSEQGVAARLNQVDPATGAVTGPLQPAGGAAPGIRDVQGLPRTVDIRYGEDQLQVPANLVRELQEFIVPRSGRGVEFL
jgi:hypothetical protein